MPGEPELIKVRLTDQGADSETPWAHDLGPAPGPPGSRKVRLVNVPFMHAKPTWGDVIIVSPVEDDFLLWDRGGVPWEQIGTRIVEDGGRWAMIVDYAPHPDAQDAHAALARACAELDIVCEAAWGPRDGKPGRVYLAVGQALDDAAVMTRLRAAALPCDLTQVHPAPVVTRPAVSTPAPTRPATTKPVVPMPAVSRVPTSKAAAAKTAAVKTAAVKASASKPSATKVPASKASASKPSATKAPASKASASKSSATKAPASKTSATRAPATKTSATKTSPSKAVAAKTTATKTPASNASASKMAASKASTAKTPAATKSSPKTSLGKTSRASSPATKRSSVPPKGPKRR